MEELWAIGNKADVEEMYADDTGRLYIYDDEKRAKIDAIALRARRGAASVFRIGIGSFSGTIRGVGRGK